MNDSPMTQRDAELLRDALRDLGATVERHREQISLTYVRKDVYDAEQRELRAEVSGHSAWLLWAQRIVMGAVFAAMLGLIILRPGGIQ